MKNINKYITEKYNTDSIEEYLESIVNSAKGKPDIYDDTESWEARDEFDYWQDTSGQWDDILEFIDKYASNKCVAGWKSKDSFESVEKLVPNIVRNIIKKKPTEIPYKKNSNKMEMWETKQDDFDIKVLKFGNYVNDNGTDYKEYWYMIAI